MSKTALVVGASGFVGPYLTRHLRSLGYHVQGTSLSGVVPEDVEAVRLDVRQRDEVRQIFGELRPAEVYHLAGVSQTNFDRLQAYYEVNVHGALHVFEAAKEVGAAVLFVSSAQVYGIHNTVLTEDTLLQPVNPYGISMAAGDMAAYCSALDGQRIVRARSFNHTGPGQGPNFLVGSLVKQVVRIEAGLEPPVIKLGNLDSVRDFCDVRDVVRAYPLLLAKGENGAVYNVASGRGISVRELVTMLLEISGIEAEVEVERSRVRATDIPYQVGNAERVRALGWQAELSLERTLRDMLEGERSIL